MRIFGQIAVKGLFNESNESLVEKLMSHDWKRGKDGGKREEGSSI